MAGASHSENMVVMDRVSFSAVAVRGRRVTPTGAVSSSDGSRARDDVISMRGLRMSYGDFEAVRGIDVNVHRGEIFAFVGPNGAGKTTTVEILEGYRRRSGGEVDVLGVDPASPTQAWRARIGVVLQTCELPAELTVRELLSRYAGYYPARRSVEETIALVGLDDKRDTRAGRLSGGQQRRLDVGLALIGDPELIFLDEPTTGFDPGARHQFWGVIDGLRKLGKTVFLTTHYMDEAEALADRVAVIAAGQIVAESETSRLGGRDAAPCEICFHLPSGLLATELPDLNGSEVAVQGSMVKIRAASAEEALWTLLGWAREHDTNLIGLEVVRPSLEDVYLDLVRQS
jgi:ABC-2 type transport system ATP-binding protein